MQYPTPDRLRRLSGHNGSVARHLALALGSLCLGFLAQPAHAQDDYDITVRSFVESQEHIFGKKQVVEHSKLYAIAGIKAAAAFAGDTSTPLKIIVDEDSLRDQLKQVLAANGFQETTWGKIPDIVITAIYGRDKLKNPYSDRTMEIEGEQMGMSGVKVVSGSFDQIQREKGEAGYETKKQKAGGDKLFLLISAWRNPGFMVKEKDHAKLLWRATVYVDDPDADLNALAAKMLAAAGPYFDRPMAKEEVTVTANAVPDGKVTVGTPVEVDPAKH